MSRELIARSVDLQRLEDAGYQIDIREGCLLVQVPYVDSAKRVQTGTLVSSLTLAGDMTTTPDTHVVHFAGSQPCNQDGTEISSIRHQVAQALMGGLVVERSFSNKPDGGYKDYFEKMTRYAVILGAAAKAVDSSASITPLPARGGPDAIFEYLDNATGRVGIEEATKKLDLRSVAIIGVGGTGSYVLDLVAKTPVRQIHLFDGDRLLQHNAFRAPGAASIDDLRLKPKKVDYFKARYSAMHRGIVAHPYAIDESTVIELADVAFAFLCMAPGATKRLVVDFLESKDKPFVDVGMGLTVVNGSITGLIGTTTSSPQKRDHFRQRVDFAEDDEGDYSTNVQIADLNALSAAFAVVKWKKMFGFYADLQQEHFASYSLTTNTLMNEDD